MDRREALQKMMAGGAVVAGASLVSSSPVFAASSMDSVEPVGAGLTTPPPAIPSVNDKRYAVFQLTSPEVMCGGTAPQVDSFVTVGQVSGNVNVAASPVGSSYMSGASTALITVTGTGPGNSPFRRGDAFEVTWHVRYVCLAGGVETRTQCRSYTYRYENVANGNPDWRLIPAPFVSSTQTCAG
jgi:hypothetical protein